MEAVGLQQNSVHLSLLILEACKGFAASRSNGEQALPLPLVLLVAPVCLHERAADAVLRASSLREWRGEGAGFLAEVPDRYRRLTGASLRALALLVGTRVIERVWTAGGLAFRIVPADAAISAPEASTGSAAEAARRLGKWCGETVTSDVLRLAGVLA